jgi:hypothetical protein
MGCLQESMPFHDEKRAASGRHVRQGNYLDTGLSKLFPLVPPVVVARCIDHTCIFNRQVVAGWAGTESAWQQPEPKIVEASPCLRT